MEDMISVRVPRELRAALERERQRMTKAAGAEVKPSAVIRALIVRGLPANERKALRGGATA